MQTPEGPPAVMGPTAPPSMTVPFSGPPTMTGPALAPTLPPSMTVPFAGPPTMTGPAIPPAVPPLMTAPFSGPPTMQSPAISPTGPLVTMQTPPITQNTATGFGMPPASQGAPFPVPIDDPRPHPGELTPLKVDRTKDELRADLKVGLTPWVMFTCVSVLFAFCYHRSAGILRVLLSVGVVLCIGEASVPLLQNRWPSLAKDLRRVLPKASWSPRNFAACGISLLLGATVGYYVYCRHVYDYWSYFDHFQYGNVWADEPAGAHVDASAIVFARGALPDVGRAASYVAGRHTYCAAPIRMAAHALDGGPAPIVQYFAVGRDCCSEASATGTSMPTNFNCDDTSVPEARAGVVVSNATDIFDFFSVRDIDFYEAAVRQAAAKHGFAAAERPLYLYWALDIEQKNRERLWRAVLQLLGASLLALPMFALLSLGTHRAMLDFKEIKRRHFTKPALALQAPIPQEVAAGRPMIR